MVVNCLSKEIFRIILCNIQTILRICEILDTAPKLQSNKIWKQEMHSHTAAFGGSNVICDMFGKNSFHSQGKTQVFENVLPEL